MYSIQDKWTNSSMDANIDEHLTLVENPGFTTGVYD